MIIENDSYWCLAKTHWKHNGTLQFLSEGGDWNSVPTKENVMTFSTKKEAEEYIRIKKLKKLLHAILIYQITNL